MHFHFSPILLPVAHTSQRTTGECLAACAVMALNYLGVSINYDRLVKRLQIQRSMGTPFPNIQELRKLGIAVDYQRGTLSELHQRLISNSPCIASVQTRELPYWNNIATQHALVVVGMDSNFAYLNDPELTSGPIQVSLGDFDLAWLDQGEMYAVLRP
jgi:ABC-type bacteriocin/lantibiotic exporter with double-glycine peptidase domain